MMPIARVRDLTKRYRGVTAVDGVGFDLQENRIHGLLGRNGAGKTTLMRLMTGQEFATSGSIEVFGRSPVENAAVLAGVSFIKESQKYPDEFQVRHVLKSAPWFFERWDAGFAERLVDDFRLPVRRRIKKLSRGQLSAVGVIVGLAARAPLTLFDEPYLGLDVVARRLFYDRLLADWAEHPRTVVLSSHLIDEISDLLERVILIEEGRILVDAEADELRGSVTTVAGARSAVDAFAVGRDVIGREGVGGLASLTLSRLDEEGRRAASAAGLELAPVSLQQLVIHLTRAHAAGTDTIEESPS